MHTPAKSAVTAAGNTPNAPGCVHIIVDLVAQVPNSFQSTIVKPLLPHPTSRAPIQREQSSNTLIFQPVGRPATGRPFSQHPIRHTTPLLANTHQHGLHHASLISSDALPSFGHFICSHLVQAAGAAAQHAWWLPPFVAIPDCRFIRFLIWCESNGPFFTHGEQQQYGHHGR